MLFRRGFLAVPLCTSKRFGQRMYCYYGDAEYCIYCGLPPVHRTPEQLTLIEAGRNDTWWRRDDDRV